MGGKATITIAKSDPGTFKGKSKKPPNDEESEPFDMEKDTAKMNGQPSDVSFKSRVKPTLNFPFLKDCGTDPLNAAHYFNLTLGGSMARKGDESHMKTLKQMFPVWYDPHHAMRQRAGELLSISQVAMSPTGLSKDAAFRASSTNLDPGLSHSQHNTTTIHSAMSSPRTQSTTSSFHFSNLPTPRLSYHSITEETSGSKANCLLESPREKDSDNPLTDSAKRLNYDYFYGMGIAFKEGVNLFPQRQPEDEYKNYNTAQLGSESIPDSRHTYNNLPLGWSSEVMDTSSHSLRLDDRQPTPKVLWRKAASALKTKTKTSASTGDIAQRVGRSQSSGNLQKLSLKSAPLMKDQSQMSDNIKDERRRRSSGMSFSGRRSSAVDRLLDDVRDLSGVSGASSSLQRRRRFSRRISDTSELLEKNTGSQIRGQALQRFRRIVRVIQMINNVCWTLKRYVREKDSKDWSFYELYLHLQKDISPTLFFDRQQFCKKEPPKGGRRLERLLTIPSYLRTPDKIQQILAFVRTHETFQCFPADVQVRFCQVMQYQSYDPRMVILKEGHPPSCFYLILSGSLIVNVRQTNPTTGQIFVQTVGIMERGECFGEIALLEEGLRTASVVCKTKTELLVINKEDFDRIVRKPLFEQRDENIECCISHQLFNEFPKDVFYKNPGHFFYQYFPKESVISMNSNDCPFLILVKSGECQLLGSYKKFDSANEKQASISRDVETLFPLYSDRKRSGTAKTRDTTSSRAESVSAITSALESTLLKERHVGSLVVKPMASSSRPRMDEIDLHRSPSAFRKHRSKTMSSVFDQLEKDKRMEMSAPDQAVQAEVDSYWSSKLCWPRQRSAASVTPQGRPKSKLWRVLNEDAKEFVQVATLKQGYVFICFEHLLSSDVRNRSGLEMLAGVDSPPLTVVSGGVECILVSKQLFLTHANIKSLRVAGDLVTTFPPPSSLRQQVNINRKWREYKKELVSAVVSSNA